MRSDGVHLQPPVAGEGSSTLLGNETTLEAEEFLRTLNTTAQKFKNDQWSRVLEDGDRLRPASGPSVCDGSWIMERVNDGVTRTLSIVNKQHKLIKAQKLIKAYKLISCTVADIKAPMRRISVQS